MKNRNSYDAWGRPRSPSTWALMPIGITDALVNNLNAMQPRFDRGYTGHEGMAGFGLINMNGRLYDPYLQRFLSPDRYVQQPENAQSYNRYSYCLNSPLMYTDPSGWQSLAAIEIYINPGFTSFMREATGRGGGSGGGGVNPLSDLIEVEYIDWYDIRPDGHGDFNHTQVIYTLKEKEGGDLTTQGGGDYIVFNGKQVVWYNGDGGIVASYKAVSGLRGSQTKAYQKDAKKGPIPEGSYTINLTLDPNRVAQRYEDTNLFYNDVGIMRVPEWMKNSGNNPWGNIMARLEPSEGTNLWGRESNFYMHDSNKRYTTGCIEIESSFFTRLLDYRLNNPSITVFVTY